MTQTASKFLGTPETIETGHAGTVLLHAPFDVAQFRSPLFEQFNVPRPSTLSKAVPKRQADFLAGRALILQAFDALHLPPKAIPIGPSRAPIWPAGMTGSVSHTRTICACILSTDTSLQVGIDVERSLNQNSDAAVRKLALNDRERQLIASQSHATDLAGLVFSAKESLFKALYPTVQRFFGFECAEMRALPEQQHLQLHLTKSLHPSLPEGAAFDVRYQQMNGHILTWLIHQS